MANLPPYRDTGVESGRGSTAGIPRWVKILGIIALIVILLVVIMLLAGGGFGGGPGGHTPPQGGH